MNSAEADRIIQDHMGYAMAAAAIPVPLADIAAVTLVQLDMVRSLSQRYGVPYDASRATAVLVSLAGASFARLGASVFKSIPVAGSLVGAAAQIALSGATTYAAGQAFRNHFEETPTFEGIDTRALRERYREYVERGRRIARSLRDAAESDVDEDVEEAVERLRRLRRTGVLTDREFECLLEPLIQG